MASDFNDEHPTGQLAPRLTERGRQRRIAMIDAASIAFIEHGFEGTTLDMIIERAGGSRGTLYSTFGGKEGLFAAVIERMIDEIFEDDSEHKPAIGSIRNVLEYYGRKFIKSVLDPKSIGLYRLIVAESPRFPAIGKVFYELGPQHSYEMLAMRLAALEGVSEDANTLYPIACQFLEMLKADLFLMLLSMPDYTPSPAQLQQRLQLCVDIIATYLESKA